MKGAVAMVAGTLLPFIVMTVAAMATPALAQEAILLVRHAEQSSPPDVVLTEAGHRRAAALAHRLKDSGITAIFTTNATRTQETAQPLAKALGITPKLIARQDVEGLVRRVTTEHKHDRVLIVNHSLNLPEILRALGYRDPPMIGVNEYDVLFVIVPRTDGPPTVLRLRL
jgi:broad specificity phosphatase PhoE